LGQRARLVAQIEAQVVRRLVVARAAGAQLAAGRAQALRQFAFEEGMDVFVVERRADLACQELRFQPVHFAQQLLQFVGRQDLGASKLLRMRA
jgi:hypothetical protein